MKIFLILLATAAIGMAQTPAPVSSPSREEIIAKAQAQIAEQRAEAAALAQAQNDARNKAKAEEAAYQKELASCWKINGEVVEVQPEGLRISGRRIVYGQAVGPEQSYLLVGYPKPVKYRQGISVLGRPEGNFTYKAVTGFNVTIPKLHYLEPR